MQSNLYRLEDIKGYLAAIDGESLGIAELCREIEGLK